MNEYGLDGFVQTLRSDRRAAVWGVVSAAGVFILFGLVTGLIPNPIYVRMVPRTGFDYLFLTLTALLAGVYVTQRLATEVASERGDESSREGATSREGEHTHDHDHDHDHVHTHTHVTDHDSNGDTADTDRLAFGGLIGGFLAVGCPICNAVLLALFSSSALMTYFDPLRPLLGAVSVALLAGLVYVRHQRTCPTCVSQA